MSGREAQCRRNAVCGADTAKLICNLLIRCAYRIIVLLAHRDKYLFAARLEQRHGLCQRAATIDGKRRFVTTHAATAPTREHQTVKPAHLVT